jgi:IclR family pca regulon transcriptional regulator
MIKVMAKSFAIIELLAKNAGTKELSVSEIAQATGVNKATATRILKDLLSLGYAAQAGNRGGYSLGPMAYYLASRGSYRKDLVDASKEALESSAKELGGASLLAVLRGGRRFVLAHANGNPEYSMMIQDTFYDDLYWTATGKTLLAYAPEPEIRAYVDSHGLPGEMWDGIDTEEKLFERLAAIRKDALLSYSRSGMGLRLYAFPVFFKGECEAVFGLCLPFGAPDGETSHDRYLAAGREAAATIEAALARNGA